MSRPQRVLFVCLGNICRSPAAEAVFNKVLIDNKCADLFEIDSAGTNGHHNGESADSRMIRAANIRGIEVPSISRQFLTSDFSFFDHIIVMDDSNFSTVTALDTTGKYHSKISKMTDYCSGQFREVSFVPDPYFGGDDGFEFVLDILNDSCLGLYKKLNSVMS
jgi:protein-tyrosine phosphatase